jgi:hypothetical protein
VSSGHVSTTNNNISHIIHQVMRKRDGSAMTAESTSLESRWVTGSCKHQSGSVTSCFEVSPINILKSLWGTGSHTGHVHEVA